MVTVITNRRNSMMRDMYMFLWNNKTYRDGIGLKRILLLVRERQYVYIVYSYH